jgi:hypothetical protein
MKTGILLFLSINADFGQNMNKIMGTLFEDFNAFLHISCVNR